MKNIILKISGFLMFLPNIVFAQTEQKGIQSAFTVVESVASNSYSNRNIYVILGDVIMVILTLVGSIFVIFMIYAGYLWMTASGNEQKVDKSKEILKQSIIGLIIVLGAYAISFFVVQIFNSQIKFN